MLGEGHRDGRHVVAARNRVVHEGAGEELARLVVDEAFHEPGGQALDGAALELRLHDRGIDGAPRIVHHGVGQQAHEAGIHVHVHDGGLGAEGPGDGGGMKIGAGIEPGLGPRHLRRGLERLGLDGGQGQARQRDALARRADHEGLAALDADVFRRGLEEISGHALGLLLHLARRLGHGGAGIGRDPATARAHAEGKQAGVAGDHVHVFEVGAQLGCGDLGQRGRVPLALRRHADDHVDLAARIHTHGGAFVGAEARALRVARQPDADAAMALLLFLALAPLVVVDQGQRAAEGAGEIRRVVRDGRAVLVDEAGLVRHQRGRDEVAQPQLGGIDAQLARAQIHQALHDEVGLGPARAAIGAVHRLVGDHALALAAEMRHAIGRAEVVHRVEREALALDGIGADVGQERIVHRHDGSIELKTYTCNVDLITVVPRRQEVFAASRDPLHGPAHLERGRAHQHLLGIDRALGAEAAAHVGHHHADLLGRQLEDGGQRIAQRVGVLRGGPHGERARVRVVIGQRRASLESHAGHPRVTDLLADDHLGLGEALVHVAIRSADGQRGVVGPVVDGGLESGRGFGIRGHGQRLVLDLDRLGAIGRLVGGLGQHDGQPLAHVDGALVGEHGDGEGPALVLAAIGRGHGALDLWQIGRGEDGGHAGQGPGRLHAYLNDAGVGMTAPHHDHVQHAGAHEVVDVTAGACEEPVVFLASGRGADEVLGRGHRGECIRGRGSGQGAGGAGRT